MIATIASVQRRAVWLALGAALVATMAAPAGASAAPQVGRWIGTRPDGYKVSFTVQAAPDGRRYAANVVYHCPDDANGDDEPGTRSYAWPIDRRGRIRWPKRKRGSSDRSSPTISGRLERVTGTIHLGVVGCTGQPGFQDVHRPVAVGWVAARPVKSGRWELSGPVGSTGEFRVLGGAVITDGVNSPNAPSTPASPFFPIPCMGARQILGTWIEPSGAFVISPARGFTFSGQFDSGDTASGTYTVGDPVRCEDGPYAFTARLVEPQPDPTFNQLALLPIPSRPLRYVAIGDSYSAGEGVKPFDPETATEGNECHRSRKAYSRVFEIAGYAFDRLFLACSGARTHNVGQLDPSGALTGTAQQGEGTIQLSRLSPADWAAVDLLTFSIGGNDADFSGVLQECILHACNRGEAAAKILARINSELPPKLASTYAAIKRAAPNATIVVLGYPQLFPRHSEPRCASHFISRAEQRFLRGAGERLRHVTRDETRKAGFHLVDVIPLFDGHEPCGRKGDWLYALVHPGGGEILRGKPIGIGSYHPNALGQRGYADALRRYLGCVIVSSWPMKPNDLPQNPPPGGAGPAGCTPR